MRAAFPNATEQSPTRPVTPFPVTASKSDIFPSVIPRSCAPSRTASANGCSDPRSNAAASASTSSPDLSDREMTSVNFGRPSVRVPVLSTIRVSTLAMRSRASASLIKTPACAPRPAAVVIEIGVARPRAQGQAIIRTETAEAMAKTIAGLGPANSQARKVTMATPTTAGTNISDT